MRTISILIPVYNEEKTVLQVVEMVHAVFCHSLEKELIIVDDGSTDSTPKLLAQLDSDKYNAKIVFHEKNQGKGAALRTAQSWRPGTSSLFKMRIWNMTHRNTLSSCDRFSREERT